MFKPCSHMQSLTTGICFAHGIPHYTMGFVLNGTVRNLITMLPDARIGDISISYCGSIGSIVTGSPRVLSTLSPSSGLFDSFVGLYTGNIIQGSIRTQI